MKNIFTPGTIGHRVAQLILKHPELTNEEIARRARQEIGSQTTQASVAWYKNKMRNAARNLEKA